ncbi:hypothetical protein CK203_098456 [Vitis vinifera]|uniref:Uncharacterized protein n=1 Tax=Vitis vinifera TaxID=29760 RepID=A0A438FIP0_VITVI|nr:hypothetical protein CK203_098456 [Vitis vinifera]
MPHPIYYMDDSKLEPIVVDESYELTTVEPLILPCYIVHFPFILSLDPDETVNQDVQYVIRGDETDEYETFVEIANMIDEIVSHDEYSDEMLMVDMSLITDDVQLETIYSLDLFRVLAIEMVDDV